ncbi:MAG: transposase [Polyangiaceae bacterium]|nr:transposase [Polyangiaceae bacterium]
MFAKTAPIGTTWSERGKRPVMRVKGTRGRTNVISAIAPHGRLWFRCFQNLNSALFIEYLDALLHDLRGHIVLVMDKHPAHISAATRRHMNALGPPHRALPAWLRTRHEPR